MTELPTYEADDVLAMIDDLDLVALVNAAFAMEVNLAHQAGKIQQEESAPSPPPGALE